MTTPSRFAVIPRRGRRVRWFGAGPCYIHHVVNAWVRADQLRRGAGPGCANGILARSRCA